MGIGNIFKIMEIWKDVIGYEEIYQVSNFGKVRNRKGKILKSAFSVGYPCVNLSDKVQKTKKVHQLVAEAFIDKDYTKKKLVVDHIDGGRCNNNLTNLRLVSHRQNVHNYKGGSDSVGITKRRNRFESNIQYDNKAIYLGTYNTEVECKEAYDRALYKILNKTFVAEEVIHRVRKSKKYPIIFNKLEQ